MEFRQLKTFQTIARVLSFNKAASILNYAPSTVSTQIKLLEEELGVALFDRLGKRIVLTQAGRSLVHYSEKILAMERETLTAVSAQEEDSGTLSLRAPQSIATCLLPEAIGDFQTRYPGVSFDISTCSYESLVHDLKTGATDLAFLLAESLPFAALKTEVLRFEPLLVIASQGHRLSAKNSLTVKDLADFSIILPKHDCSYRMNLESIFTEEKVKPEAIIQMNCLEAIKECVHKGIGIAMLPMMVVAGELNRGEMVSIPLEETRLETAILMIWHRDKWLSPMLRDFMRIVRKVMK